MKAAKIPILSAETTNEPMASVISMWREPPTTEEVEEHKRVVETLSETQQMAINCLQHLIQTDKSKLSNFYLPGQKNLDCFENCEL